MEDIQVNGAAATHRFIGADSSAVAFGRPGRADGGYVVETREGIRRKFATIGAATAWLGALRSEPLDVAAGEKPPSRPKK